MPSVQRAFFVSVWTREIQANSKSLGGIAYQLGLLARLGGMYRIYWGDGRRLSSINLRLRFSRCAVLAFEFSRRG